MNASDLGEKITQIFDFMYEINGDYYVLGSGYFRPCTNLEMGVYKGFKEAMEGKNEDWIIEQYKRVRKYVSDCQPSSSVRAKEIKEFVQGLNEEELESLSKQMNRAIEYAQVAYK